MSDEVRKDDPVGAFVPHGPPRIAGSGSGPLAGRTFAVKDLFDIEGYVTGGGSLDWLRTHRPAAHTADAVQRLLDAGANMIGKTVCDELFYSITGANAHYGTPINSRAPDRLPGGSSSGSAAAVAAGLCDFALGSDTGGSVRMPASFCGIFGLRPTHGRVDLSHAMAMAPSFDTGGWFAADAGIFRRVGRVLLDDAAVGHDIERVVIANDALQWAGTSFSVAVGSFLDSAAGELPEPEVGRASMERFAEARECFRVLQAVEVWQTFGAWAKETRPKFGPGIRERMRAASRVKEEEVAEAAVVRDRVRDDLRGRLEPGTVICLPTAASLPPLRDAGAEELDEFRARSMGLSCLASLSGLPQVSIPGAEIDGCPVGVSFIGWAGGDEALLALAERLAPHCYTAGQA